jgi:hypothetical protein
MITPKVEGLTAIQGVYAPKAQPIFRAKVVLVKLKYNW